MTLAEIKNKVGVTNLELNTATDADDKPTDWMRHWNNDERVAISIHKELVEKIKVNPAVSNLAIQTEIKVAAKGNYTSYRIVQYTEAELVL